VTAHLFEYLPDKKILVIHQVITEFHEVSRTRAVLRVAEGVVGRGGETSPWSGLGFG